MSMKEDGKFLEKLVTVKHEFGLNRLETDFLFSICAFELVSLREFILKNGWDESDPLTLSEIKCIFDIPSLEELAVNILDARGFLTEAEYKFRN